MREILFKGKKIDSGEWVKGDLVTKIDPCLEINKVVRAGIHNRTIFGEPESVDMNTICQFIGLLDKNGNEIFENDIVKTKYDREYQVVWLSTGCHCGFDLLPYNNITDENKPTTWDLYHSENLEVIGNIYD